MLVDFVHKLRAMLDHPIHRAVLQELSILVAVLAIVKAHASAGVGSTILFSGKRHSAALAELRQLLLIEILYLSRERGLERLEVLRILVGYIITFGRNVSAFDTVQIARDDLLGEEIRHLAVLWLSVVVIFKVLATTNPACL